ncbi:MAG: TIGR00159 family protein [Sphingomonadales bacterium]|nr:TIGR00159 family protein [Sphingomonadales bacterium]MBM3923974.1 TIGR00159 family protein [Sphingomonadales bacterium]
MMLQKLHNVFSYANRCLPFIHQSLHNLMEFSQHTWLNWHNLMDWSLVAILLAIAWRLIRGSLVVYLLVGVIAFNLLFQLAQWLELPLFSAFLEQFVGLGVLALIIVFQPEIRKFLLMIGRNAEPSKLGKLGRLMDSEAYNEEEEQGWIRAVSEACARLSETRTGALIVIARTSELKLFAASGMPVDALVSSDLLEAIFRKESPLHDGAVILAKGRIQAASCVLPLDEHHANPSAAHGMRHKAALGMSEQTDALVVLVSEESGQIVLADNGQFSEPLTPNDLMHRISKTL